MVTVVTLSSPCCHWRHRGATVVTMVPLSSPWWYCGHSEVTMVVTGEVTDVVVALLTGEVTGGTVVTVVVPWSLWWSFGVWCCQCPGKPAGFANPTHGLGFVAFPFEIFRKRIQPTWQ